MSAGGGSATPKPSVGPTSSACLEELPARGVAAVRRAAASALDPGEELCIKIKAHRNDLVTQVDRGIEECIADHLEATGVSIHGEEVHRVEDFETYRGRAWVFDPTDGTLNYVATHRDWVIFLALIDDGVPTSVVLADPMVGRLHTVTRGRGAWAQPLLAGPAGINDAASRALERLEDLPLSKGVLITHYQLMQNAGIGQAIEASRGTRCYGATALEMAEMVADGAVVHIQPRLQPWSVAAGTLLCAETDAVLTRMDRVPFDMRRAGSLLVGTPTAYAEVLGHLRAVGV